MEEERLMILKLLAEGKISQEEAAQLLQALEDDGAAAAEEAEVRTDPAPATGGDQQAPSDPQPSPAPPEPPDPPEPPAFSLAGLGDLVEGLVSRLTLGRPMGFAVAREERTGDLTGDDLLVDVRLESTNGRIVVRGWDENGFRVVVTREARGDTEAEARQRGEKLAPLVVEGGRLSLQAVNHPDLHQCAVELWLPRKLRGSLNLRTGNGRVEVAGVSGTEARMWSGNGRVSLTDGSWREVKMRSGNGRVQFRGEAQEATLTSGNGSAEVVVGPRTGEVTVSTGNGSITIDTRELRGTGLRLDVATGVGGVKNEIPDLVVEHETRHLTGHRLKAHTREAEQEERGVSIQARTGVGSVTLR